MTNPALILIVEDNECNLKLVSDLLGYHGYRRLSAVDAETAIELARDHRPDLVLMDIQLPGMDGVQALGHLRAAPATAGLRVVALTSFAMKDDRHRLLAEGFDGYLEKPINVRALPEQIAGFLATPVGRST